MKKNKEIYVTKPFLPPIEEFQKRLPEIWNSRILSNRGPLVRELEAKLCDYLGVKHISLVNNATIGLMVALKALDISGDVITPTFSFSATAHSIAWNNLNPVFVDIENNYLNIDPQAIMEAITENTTAIMPVHCYGNVCMVNEIKNIAKENNLKVIYDAAHAFGANDINGSILNHGDLSVVSFHATKVFNTFEGGAIISHNEDTKKKIDRLLNFSLDSSKEQVDSLGLNGKMSEISALNGICQLNHIDEVIAKRKSIYLEYESALSNVDGIRFININSKYKNGYSYIPILINNNFKISRDEFVQKLEDKGIYTRKYFYPLITDLHLYKDKSCLNTNYFKNAQLISNQIVCLPVYPDLSKEDLNYIIESILEI